jgi:hypothetical protein
MSLTYDSIKELTQNLELKCKSIAMEIYFDSSKSNLYYLFCSKRSYAVLSLFDHQSFLIEIYDENGDEINTHRLAIPIYMLRDFKENSNKFNDDVKFIIEDTISTMLNHPFFNLDSNETSIFSSILNTNYYIMAIAKYTNKDEVSFDIKLELKKDRQVCLVRFKKIKNQWVKELLNAINKPSWCKNLNANIMKYFDLKALEFYQTSDSNIFYINSKGMKYDLEIVFNEKEKSLTVSRINKTIGSTDKIDYFVFQYENTKNIDQKIFESLYKEVIFDTPNIETLQQLRDLELYNSTEELDNNYIDLLDMIKY